MEKQSKNALDTVLEKKPKGRKRRIDPRWVVGSADTYGVQFSNAWPKLGDQLLAAGAPEEVLSVLEQAGGLISGTIDLKFSTRVFEIIHDSKFPRARVKSQIRFLADSLGGSGTLSFRRSRDVCAEERAKAERANHIVRYEYYVECSCGYEGHSQNHACRNCGAPILLPLGTA